MMEITEEDDEDEDISCAMNTEATKERIREMIKYQKSIYLSSSSFSSAASSSSLSSSSRKSSSLLDLMKGGSTSLRRLFDMEHISLATHFKDYSASPVTKPILLWGSDSDNGGAGGICRSTSWNAIKQFKQRNDRGGGGGGSDELSGFASNGSIAERDRRARKKIGRLIRTRSYKKLPGINLWWCKGFRFRLRLRRLKIMICGRTF